MSVIVFILCHRSVGICVRDQISVPVIGIGQGTAVRKLNCGNISFFICCKLVFWSCRRCNLPEIIIVIIGKDGLVSFFIFDGSQHSKVIKCFCYIRFICDGVLIDRIAFFSLPKVKHVFFDLLSVQFQFITIRCCIFPVFFSKEQNASISPVITQITVFIFCDLAHFHRCNYISPFSASGEICSFFCCDRHRIDTGFCCLISAHFIIILWNFQISCRHF